MMNKHGGYAGDDLIDFSVNINPTPKPDGIETIYQAGYEQISHYPEIDQLSLRRFLSRRLGASPDEILVGNGATELMYLLAQALEVKTVGIFEPTYTEYRRAFELFGKQVISIPLPEANRFVPAFDDLPACDLYILCNPNNPTGTYQPNLSRLVHRDALVILDESFLDFVVKPELWFAPNIIHLRSLTKFYALAGLRLGYVLADEDIIRRMRRYQPPWSVNAIALEIIRPLMESADFRQRTNEWLKSERQVIEQALPQAIGGAANFYLIKARPDSFSRLKQRGFFLRQCDDFNGLGEDYLRFCIHTRENNLRLLEALKEIL